MVRVRFTVTIEKFVQGLTKLLIQNRSLDKVSLPQRLPVSAFLFRKVQSFALQNVWGSEPLRPHSKGDHLLGDPKPGHNKKNPNCLHNMP